MPRLKPSGIFIASGVVEEHHDTVIEALKAVGMTHLETHREDIWVCIVARREDVSLDFEALQKATNQLPPLKSPDTDWAN